MFRPDPDNTRVSGWDVRQWSWCPVIPWIRSVYGVTEPPTYSMSEGVGIDPCEAATLAGLPVPIRCEVLVRHPKLPAYGQVDVVAGEGPYAVAEVKAFKRRDFSHYLEQLRYYTWLVNDAVGPVREAYLIMGRQIKRYVVDRDFLLRGMMAAESVIKVKSLEEPPMGRRDRCWACWYRRYCVRRPSY